MSMEGIVGKLLYIFKRLREPSTHVALAGLLALVGQHIPEETWNQAINGAAVLFGIIGVFVAESGPKTQVDGF